MEPPFNNCQRRFLLILDGGTSVFLLADRGGVGEEASEVLRLRSARCKASVDVALGSASAAAMAPFGWQMQWGVWLAEVLSLSSSAMALFSR
jgi:hypothetical protein